MSTERLEKLRQKKTQIDARIHQLKARDSVHHRKQETRRKIIAGALALHHLQKNPNDVFSRKLSSLLDAYVTKSYERKLFGLPALPEELTMIANDKFAPERSSRKKLPIEIF